MKGELLPARGTLVMLACEHNFSVWGIVLGERADAPDRLDVFLCNGLTVSVPPKELIPQYLSPFHGSGAYAFFGEILPDPNAAKLMENAHKRIDALEEQEEKLKFENEDLRHRLQTVRAEYEDLYRMSELDKPNKGPV